MELIINIQQTSFLIFALCFFLIQYLQGDLEPNIIFKFFILSVFFISIFTSVMVSLYRIWI